MTKVKPHDTFGYIRADEVAECWDGVGLELCRRLWSNIVAKMPERNFEMQEEPCVGQDNLAEYWHLLSEPDQRRLNELAEEQEKLWN